MSEAKQKPKRLFDVSILDFSYTVAATTPAKARKWASDRIVVVEIGAVEAVGIEKATIQEAE